MSYELLQFPRAVRQLRRLRRINQPQSDAIIKAISALSKTPRPPGAEKLVNRPELRIRVGDYRIIYLVDDKKRAVTITAVAHRREVYR